MLMAAALPTPGPDVVKFYFCETCGKRITDRQILEGLGRDKKLKGVYCKECAVGVTTMEMDAINIENLARPSPPRASPPPAGIRTAGNSPARSERSDIPPQSPGSASNGRDNRVAVFGALGIVVVVIAVALTMRKQSPLEEPARPVVQTHPVASNSRPETTSSLAVETPRVVPPAPSETNSATNGTPKTSAPVEKGPPETSSHVTPPPVETKPTESATPTQSLDFGGGVKLDLVSIPAGQFQMGSTDGEPNEKPVHTVKITKPFYMGKYAVTQAQYEKIMGGNPSFFKGADCPVETVSFVQAEQFCAKAGGLCGRIVRLPTEAEWEYACRAGTATKFNTGNDEAALGQAAWYKDNSGAKTHPVGQKQPNAWGLYDMHGNVAQWCQDYYSVAYYANSPEENPRCQVTNPLRVLRGSSWADTPPLCRPTYRKWYRSDLGYRTFGFRIVVEIP
jgi:formylglycine-generating enzyme required for sulfatase activity